MTAIWKLRRTNAEADLDGVEGMLNGLGDADFLTRLSLEGRRDELRRELDSLPDEDDQTASAAIFFGGRPVVGSMGIESEFGGSAITQIQDLVSKQFAHDTGGLGQRGVVPGKDFARLHVTDVLRGSFGFLLEELQPQGNLVDSSLKKSLETVTNLMSAFGSRDEEVFVTAVENADARVLAAARDFFTMMSREGATMRLVTGEHESSFDEIAVAIAASRADVTTVKDFEREIVGRLWVLPESHMFEIRAHEGTLKGKIDRSISASDAAMFMSNWLQRDAVARLAVRQIVRDGEIARESFTLKGVRDPDKPQQLAEASP